MKPAPWSALALLVGGVLLMSLNRRAAGQVDFKLTIENLPADFKQIEKQIESNILAAARMWAEPVAARRCTIDIVFRVDAGANLGRGSGRSATTAPLGTQKHEGKRVLEQGWAAEMRTGKDPNGDQPDVELVLGPDYMRTLWWDPDPVARKARIPANKLDAVTVILHELGHALAFNGWINPQSGTNDRDVASTFDRWVKYDGQNFFFHGPAAMKLWGGPVPLARTNNNYHHVCDKPEGPQAKLKDDLMNGVTFGHGRRYAIGPMDLAILADCAIPLKPQKPAKGKSVAPAPLDSPTPGG